MALLNLGGGGAAGAPPAIAFAGGVTLAEGAGGTTAFAFTLQLARNGSTAAIPFSWAVAGSGPNPAGAADFVGGALPGGSGTFAPGETSKTLIVAVAGDSVVEPDEGFTVTASASLPLAGASAIGLILNDDVTAPAATPLANDWRTTGVRR